MVDLSSLSQQLDTVGQIKVFADDTPVEVVVTVEKLLAAIRRSRNRRWMIQIGITSLPSSGFCLGFHYRKGRVCDSLLGEQSLPSR